MNMPELKTLISVSVLLTVGMLAQATGRADTGALAYVQDPPVIPRVFGKRPSPRPERYVRTELFFGTATPDAVVTEERFLAFLDTEVTPRFPDGLTLFKGHGRFTGEDGVLVKEDPFVVILLHPREHFKVNDKKIEEIRRLYKDAVSTRVGASRRLPVQRPGDFLVGLANKPRDASDWARDRESWAHDCSYGSSSSRLLGAPFGVIAQDGQKGTLLVVNRTGGSISLFDLGTRVEMARVPIGPIIPHEVAVSPNGRLALTSEYGPNDNPGRHLVAIDVAEGRQAGRIDLGPKSRPHSIVFMKDGQRAVTTLELSDRVALVDVPGQKVIRMYPTGGREGHMVRLSPDGTRAYVTSRGAAGTLSVISLEGDTPPVVIPTGEGAEGLAVSPDGREVWVVNRVAGTISIVDTRSLTVAATIDVPPDARRAEISAGGRVLGTPRRPA